MSVSDGVKDGLNRVISMSLPIAVFGGITLGAMQVFMPTQLKPAHWIADQIAQLDWIEGQVQIEIRAKEREISMRQIELESVMRAIGAKRAKFVSDNAEWTRWCGWDPTGWNYDGEGICTAVRDMRQDPGLADLEAEKKKVLAEIRQLECELMQIKERAGLQSSTYCGGGTFTPVLFGRPRD